MSEVQPEGLTYMVNKDTGGTTEMSLVEPGAREFWEARGWEVTDRPEAGPFVPPKAVDKAADEDGWVTLHHPEIGASHAFPNNPDAVQGAYEAGWQVTPPKAAADQEQADAEQAESTDLPQDPPAAGRAARKTASSAKASEQGADQPSEED